MNPHAFPKRWIVAVEYFTVLSEERFVYHNYASLGRAQDERNRINDDAAKNNIRCRARLIDKNKLLTAIV